MLSALLSGKPKAPTHVVAIDLGQRTTKAVSVQRKGTSYELSNYVFVDSPSVEKQPSPEALSEHLKSVVEAVDGKSKPIALILGVNDSILRHTELPLIPVEDIRLMLKYNSKAYLQQDLPDHVFDAYLLAAMSELKPGEAQPKQPSKARAIVGGAKRQLIEGYQTVCKLAGLSLHQIIPSLICPANAFEVSPPDALGKEMIALVDVGFRTSTISLVSGGELSLTRVLSLGADKITQGLAESMNMSYEEAESIKIGLPDEVQGMMQALIAPLGRELRASIDFFEHQRDRQVGHVFVSGGSARSAFLVESLQTELLVPTKTWNPAASFSLALPPEKRGEIEQVASQLAVALGGAIAAL